MTPLQVAVEGIGFGALSTATLGFTSTFVPLPVDDSDWRLRYSHRGRPASGSAYPVLHTHVIEGDSFETGTDLGIPTLHAFLRGQSRETSFDSLGPLHGADWFPLTYKTLIGESFEGDYVEGSLSLSKFLSGISEEVCFDSLGPIRPVNQFKALSAVEVGEATDEAALLVTNQLSGDDAGASFDSLGPSKGVFRRR